MEATKTSEVGGVSGRPHRGRRGVGTQLTLGALVALALLSGARAQAVSDLRLRTWLGEEVPLGALLARGADEGRLTLVNVWALWCAPCRDELPLLQEQAGRYNFITLNLGDDPDGVADFLYEEALEALPTYFLSVREAQPLQLLGLPTTLVFDAQGTLRRTVHGPLDMERLGALLLEESG